MLTAKQEKFCQNIAKGMNQSEAYRNAFNISKAKQESVHTLASRLLKKVEVKSRLSELKQQTTEGIKYTVEDSFRKLSEIQALALARKRKFGIADPDLTNAIKAEELKGKLKGLYVNKTESDVTLGGSINVMPSVKLDGQELALNIGDNPDVGTAGNS